MARDNGKPFKFKEDRPRVFDPQISIDLLLNGETEAFREHITAYPTCVDMKDTTNGNVPLHIICSRGDMFLINFMIAKGANLNTQDLFGNSALHYATDKGKQPAVELLLKSGANANLQDHRGNSPLHIACVNNDVEVVRTLLKYNADPELMDFSDMKPRDKTKSPMIKSLIDRRIHQITIGDQESQKQTIQWMSLGVGLGVGLGMAMAKQQHILMEQHVNRLLEKPKRKGAFGGGVTEQPTSNALVTRPVGGTGQRKML